MRHVQKKYRTLFLAGCLVASSLHVWSQQMAAEHEVKVLTASYGDSIVIRWAPTTPASWQLLNQYGYRIERSTIVRDSVVLRTDEKIILNNAPVKAAPLEKWKNDALREELVAVAAQAIYGTSFQLTTARSSSLADVVNKSRELESRFSFCLFSCDLSVRAAVLSGLRYTDTHVRKNEKYLYRVYPLIPDNVLKVSFGFAFQSTREVLSLTEPRSPLLTAADHGARIEWDPNPLRTVYSAYYLEKSEDGGKTFLSMRSIPIVPVSNTANEFQIVVIGDSLRENGKEYFYRLRGMNPFGDKGPYSRPVSVVGIADMKGNVSWGDNQATIQNTVMVRWKFLPAWEKDIKNFTVERAPRESGPYLTITSPPLERSVREYEDKKPLSSNYYRIATLGNSGKKIFSTPYLVQLEDSIPPLTPSGIKAAVDSAGIVKISWTQNQENDLLGYHVYRSNFKSSEFARVTRSPLVRNGFTDTVNVKTLTGKVYYKVTAIDRRFNPSPYSEALELIRPDHTPPVPPVVSSIKSSKDGVSICWINSSSDDVVRHLIYRRENPVSAWVLAKAFEKNDSTCFIDRPAKKITYQYKIVAQDTSHLTAASQLFTAKSLNAVTHRPVSEIKAMADRTGKQIRLTWNYQEADVTKYLVYRAEQGATLSLYGSLPGSASGFADVRPAVNTSYVYRVKAIFSDGLESAFSEEVRVQY
jgi:fibronectin type 3 domain-containing protein